MTDVDQYRRLLLASGAGVFLPKADADLETLNMLCEHEDCPPELAFVIRHGTFNDGDRVLLVLPPDLQIIRQLIAALKAIPRRSSRILEVLGQAAGQKDDFPRPKKFFRRILPVFTPAMIENLKTEGRFIESTGGWWLKKIKAKPSDFWDTRFYGQPCLRVKRIKPDLVPSSGNVTGREKLGAIFDVLNEAAFSGALPKPKIKWGKKAGGHASEAWAHTDLVKHEIVFSRNLFGPFLPLGFLWSVMYHEMLHVACPPTYPMDGGHHSDFNEKEAMFPDHGKWMRVDREMSREIEMHKNGIVPISSASPPEVRRLNGLRFRLDGVSYTIRFWWKKARKPTVVADSASGQQVGVPVKKAKLWVKADSRRVAANADDRESDVKRILFRSLLTGELLAPVTTQQNPAPEIGVVT